jgi:hypothetical protein
MSTDPKSAAEKAEEALNVEKLTETEQGQLAGGFSESLSDEVEQPGDGDINIFKCHCGSTTA